MYYYHLSKEHLQAAVGNEHSEIVPILTNLVVLHSMAKQTDSVFYYLDVAEQLQNKITQRPSRRMGLILTQRGVELYDVGRIEESYEATKKAIEIYRVAVGERHSELAFAYRNLTEILLTQNRLKEALISVQQATISNSRQLTDTTFFGSPEPDDWLNFLVLDKVKTI